MDEEGEGDNIGYTVRMFESSEIKQMRQEIDGLTEQVRLLNENSEFRHQEVVVKLDLLSDALDELIQKEVSTADIEDIKATMETTQSEVSDLIDVVNSIDEQLTKE